LEGGAVRFLSSLDIFPEINAATLSRGFVVYERLMDEVRITLPNRNARSIFGHGLFSAQSFR
jgi:hypothetical protein